MGQNKNIAIIAKAIIATAQIAPTLIINEGAKPGHLTKINAQSLYNIGDNLYAAVALKPKVVGDTANAVANAPNPAIAYEAPCARFTRLKSVSVEDKKYAFTTLSHACINPVIG